MNTVAPVVGETGPRASDESLRGRLRVYLRPLEAWPEIEPVEVRVRRGEVTITLGPVDGSAESGLQPRLSFLLRLLTEIEGVRTVRVVERTGRRGRTAPHRRGRGPATPPPQTRRQEVERYETIH